MPEQRDLMEETAYYQVERVKHQLNELILMPLIALTAGIAVHLTRLVNALKQMADE